MKKRDSAHIRRLGTGLAASLPLIFVSLAGCGGSSSSDPVPAPSSRTGTFGSTAVAGLTLSALFAANGWLGQWFEAIGISVAYTPLGIMIAMSFTSLPFVVRAVQPVLEDLTPDVEEAAATLGAPPAVVFARVTLPLIFPGILAGAVMGFAKAMGEFGATITFVANIPGQTQTLPSAIWTALQVPGGESRALAMAALAGLVALGAVLLSEALARRVAARIAGAR